MVKKETWLKIIATKKSYLESSVDLKSVSVGAAVGELDGTSCIFPHLHLGIMHKRLTLQARIQNFMLAYTYRHSIIVP